MSWHPTLSSIEGKAEAHQPGWRKRVVQDPDMVLGSALGRGGGCWCGSNFGHDWPGKADGEPHPRDWPGRVNGHPFR